MIDVLGQMWLPVVLTFVVTALVTVGLLVRRAGDSRSPAGADDAAPDTASS